MQFWTAFSVNLLGAVVVYLLWRFLAVWTRKRKIEIDLLVEEWVERTVERIVEVIRESQKGHKANPGPRRISTEDEILETVQSLARVRRVKICPLEVRYQIRQILSREKRP